MRLMWFIAAAYVLGWCVLIAAVWLALRLSDRRERRRIARAPLAPVVNLSPSKRLGPGFGLSGGQVRRKASRGRRERQGGM